MDIEPAMETTAQDHPVMDPNASSLNLSLDRQFLKLEQFVEE
jgi:hypothetical protein